MYSHENDCYECESGFYRCGDCNGLYRRSPEPLLDPNQVEQMRIYELRHYPNERVNTSELDAVLERGEHFALLADAKAEACTIGVGQEDLVWETIDNKHVAYARGIQYIIWEDYV